MTNEEWEKLERTVTGVYFSVELMVDGYKVTLQPARLKPMTYAIAVYVDGKIKGEWLTNDCEIRRKFYRCGTKSLMSKKEINEWLSQYPKRERAKAEKEIKELYKYNYYEPYFSSFRTLKSHLLRNNTSIEWIKI